jgi:hypothetical protein
LNSFFHFSFFVNLSEALVLGTAVSPSTNPGAKLNQQFLVELDNLTEWKQVEDGLV